MNPLSAHERAVVDAAEERDRSAWADQDTQRIAREVAEDLFHSLVYLIAHGDVASLEAFRAQWNLASLDEAVAICRQRAAHL